MEFRRSLARGLPPVIAAAALVSCDAPTRPPGASDAGAVRLSAGPGGGVLASATGGGHYLLQDALVVQFGFSAIQHASGKVMGQFHHALESGGETADFRGEVTCLAVDPVTDRAWIGGVITANRSTSPAFQQEWHQPGKDVWFRVVDNGEGADDPPDRTTFLGFENTPGIPTSEFYCALRPWPAGDLRTWPVTTGNISVRP